MLTLLIVINIIINLVDTLNCIITNCMAEKLVKLYLHILHHYTLGVRAGKKNVYNIDNILVCKTITDDDNADDDVVYVQYFYLSVAMIL